MLYMWLVSADKIAFYRLFENAFFTENPLLKDGKNTRETISSNFKTAAANQG